MQAKFVEFVRQFSFVGGNIVGSLEALPRVPINKSRHLKIEQKGLTSMLLLVREADWNRYTFVHPLDSSESLVHII